MKILLCSISQIANTNLLVVYLLVCWFIYLFVGLIICTCSCVLAFCTFFAYLAKSTFTLCFFFSCLFVSTGMVSERKANAFACCPGKIYPDLTFTITIRRKPLFYVVNLVIPCALISAMSMVEFILPCNSGEKVSLGITVLLSLTVFMLVVAENMPATSDDIPILGRF